ncbi:phosphotransferase, partial [Curtobacterium sp. P97]|uniref:phosphotransferase n=1 Tax=Curtobacterium sp. P97 TaxID=2939562 RepID=UPI0020409052
ACAEVWAEALATSWSGEPVWFHGDLAPGNLLAVDGRLSAVIDFGVCGVGDPACDLVIAWTWLGVAGRAAFRDAVDLDEGTWARARGWALWKALITEPGSPLHGEQQRALTTLLAERRTRRPGTPAYTDTDTDTARTGEQPGPRAGMSDPRG